MLQQLGILIILYLIGLLFAAIFYPKLSLGLILSSGLYWGALINTFLGVILGLFHAYSGVIWIIFVAIIIFLVLFHLKTKRRWESLPIKNIVLSLIVLLLCIFVGFLFFGKGNQLITSSTSLPYIILGSRIYNHKTISLPGAGYDFRSQYGISEMLIYSLGNFINLPAISLWHPFIWLSQYIFLFCALVDYSKDIGTNKKSAYIIAGLAIIWTATSSMNWFLAYYIHVHLFSSFSIFISVYFFWKMVNSSEENKTYAILSSLALCGYGFSRVESPIMIFIILIIHFLSYEFKRNEFRLFFFPPIALMTGWLYFLFFTYKDTTTQYWSDNRLIFAIGAYIFLLISLLVLEFLKIDIKKKWAKNHIYIGFILVPLILAIIDFSKFINTLESFLRKLFGPFQQLGHGPWEFYWFEIIVLIIPLVASIRPWERNKLTVKNSSIFINIIISYLILILILGFFREKPYAGTRWGDSATRMLTHISPTIIYITIAHILKILQPRIKN